MQRARDVFQVECLRHRCSQADLPARANSGETVHLIMGRALALRRLLLEASEEFKLTLTLQDSFDRIDT